MKKVVYTAILLVLSAALLLCFAGCNKTSGSSTTVAADATEQTVPEESTIPTGPADGSGVGSRDDFFDDAPPPETEPKPSEEPSVPSTEPTTEPTTEPVEPPKDITDPDKVTYEQYEAMTREQKKAFMKNFATTDDFIDWLAEARANSPKDDVVILDGDEIDLGKLLP